MRIAILGMALALGCLPAIAAEPEPGPRYTFVPVGGGALRLDTATGEVVRCSVAAGGSAHCVAVAWDDAAADPGAAALEARIAALEERIAELESERAGVPDEEAMERVMVLTERMMRRFFTLVHEFKDSDGEDL